MFSVVENCVSPKVCGNRETKKMEPRLLPRRCAFVYYYFDHPEVGFGHVRLQTWLPFSVKICLNGRHWLEKQLLAHGIEYAKKGNCFTWIEDAELAQAFLDEQLKAHWPTLLGSLVEKTCPGLRDLLAPVRVQYYWSAEETEYATDVMFRSGACLDALFPKLVQYGMRVSDCHAVLRYFGRREPGCSLGKAPDDVQSDCRKRHEGVRIKHWVNGDSIKLYNKARNVLRAETTINKPRNFKAFRQPNDDGSKPPSWQKMRKGVQDLHRRCLVSSRCNARYLDALTAADVDKTLREISRDVCNRTVHDGRTVRGLNPWNEQDFRFLTFLAKGEWNVNGFRNLNLCQWLEPDLENLSPRERKKLSAKVTRLIRLLRAHRLIYKVGKTHRYMLSKDGMTFATALTLASNLQAKQLTEKVA